METRTETEGDQKTNLYRKALSELNLNTSGFVYREEDGETLDGVVKKGFTFVTDNAPMSNAQRAEVETKFLELQAEYDTQDYARNRDKEYPPWKEQLDYMYHNGFEKWKTDMIDPVKDKYPKG